MGLRIIGRAKKIEQDLTEAERTRELEHTVADWLQARGGTPLQDAKAEFMAHFCRVKSRMQGPAEPDTMLQMAHQLRASLRGVQNIGMEPHSKVDVATLLELL